MSSANTDTKQKPQKTDFKEFWNISKWAILLSLKLDARNTIISQVSNALLKFYDVASALIFAKIIDQMIKVMQMPSPSLKPIYPYLLLSIGLQFLQRILMILYSYSSRALRNTTAPKITQTFYTKLNILGIQTIEQPGINDTIHRASRNLYDIVSYTDALIQFISNTVSIVGLIAIIFSFFPIFIPVLIITTIPFILYDKKFRSIYYNFDYENTEDYRKSKMSADTLSDSGKLQEVTITKSLNFLDKKYIDFQTWYAKSINKITKTWRTGNQLFGFLTDVVGFAGYIKIFLNLIAKTISIGDVTFQIRTLGNAQSSLMGLFRGLNDLFESSLYIRDAYILFNMKTLFKDGEEVMPKLISGPEVRFIDVSFKYPNAEKTVIQYLNLRINKGEKIAIVGHNGAGKTTLVKLIARIYQTTDGEILINNKNLNEIYIDSWYKNMGVLFQDFNTYPQLTVKENIYIGNTEEPLNELGIRLAAQAADAIGFIEEYPKGFDTILGEKYKGGIRPSTGQWQKLAIARFFYRNAPLVIFDEPTASIDAVSEYNIFNKIYNFFEDKTVIIISHRFSTVRNADRIIVMEKGRIIEEGTHDHLMSLGGYYAKAFMLQAEAYSTKEDVEKSPSKEDNMID